MQPGKSVKGTTTTLPSNRQQVGLSPSHLQLTSSRAEETTSHDQPFIIQRGRRKRDVPSWLGPFFSLRAQLTSVCFLLLLIAVGIMYTLYIQHMPSIYLGVALIVVLALSTLLAFFFITLLLQPLWRVTDAAQAIAAGDLKQRQRLPVRLPPQDEVDRLAGSLNEMVTHLEHAEEAEHVAEWRFQRFFSDASHQLRTPLTSLRGFTEVLMRGGKDDPETAQHVLKLMKNEGERMTCLINDLLTLSRLDDGRPMKTQYVDLIEIAADRIEYAKARASDERSIVLHITTQEQLGVQGNKDHLKQLLFILLDNALKYGRPAPDGKIVVDLARRDGTILIRVIDNGEEIDQEDLAHIFDSFYRGQHRQPSSSISGTGLGLTIANAIVRAHKGTISVESAPETGTVFTITLPCIK